MAIRSVCVYREKSAHFDNELTKVHAPRPVKSSIYLLWNERPSCPHNTCSRRTMRFHQDIRGH